MDQKQFKGSKNYAASIFSKVDEILMMIWPRLKRSEKREVKEIIFSLRE
jgi:hypothetical protein